MTSGYGAAPGSDVNTGPSSSGVPSSPHSVSPKCTSFTVAIVDEQPTRRLRQRRDLGRQQRRRLGAVDRDRVRRRRLEADHPGRVVRTRRDDAPVTDPRLDLALVVGPERHDDLVGPDREQLRVVDHAGPQLTFSSAGRCDWTVATGPAASRRSAPTGATRRPTR